MEKRFYCAILYVTLPNIRHNMSNNNLIFQFLLVFVFASSFLFFQKVNTVFAFHFLSRCLATCIAPKSLEMVLRQQCFLLFLLLYSIIIFWRFSKHQHWYNNNNVTAGEPHLHISVFPSPCTRILLNFLMYDRSAHS